LPRHRPAPRRRRAGRRRGRPAARRPGRPRRRPRPDRRRADAARQPRDPPRRDRGKHPDLAPSVPRQPRPAQPPPRRRPPPPRPPRRRPPPAPPTRPLRTLLGGRPPRPRRRLPTRRGRPLLGQADQDRPARRAALPATPLLLFQRPLARTPPAVL